MKKISCIFITLFLILFSVSAAIEGLPVTQKFSLYFNKPGETDFHFTKKGSTTMTEEETFESYFGTGDEVSASFGFDWALYVDGNIKMSLVFAPTLAAADKAYDDPASTDYMLSATDKVTYYPGLNYVVDVFKGTVDGASFSAPSIGSTTHDKISGSARTIVLIDKQLSDIEGSIGHVDFDLTLHIPAPEEDKALMETQYKGVVKMFIESK